MPKRLDIADADFEAQFQEVLGAKRESDVDVNEAVTAILKDVATRGDAAVIEYTNRFDRQNITAADMAFTADDLAEAEQKIECARVAIIASNEFDIVLRGRCDLCDRHHE